MTEIFEAFPYLIVKNAAGAIEFYKKVFGAKELTTYTEPGGRIAHAELKFGPLIIMLADEFPENDIHGPSDGKSGSRIHLHINNVDELAGIAAKKGAIIKMEPTDQSHGERQCRILDPFGHEWLLGHQIEELSNEEIQKRINTDFVT